MTIQYPEKKRYSVIYITDGKILDLCTTDDISEAKLHFEKHYELVDNKDALYILDVVSMYNDRILKMK